ncbi:MAG: hypothetical protein AB1750_09135, partial [Chloroflexota bacterium]
MQNFSRRYPQEERPPNDWLDRLARFQLHFGRFLRDALGIALAALALMSLLAIWDATEGALLTPWANLLTSFFGVGSYLVVFGLAALGIFLLRRDA